MLSIGSSSVCFVRTASCQKGKRFCPSRISVSSSMSSFALFSTSTGVHHCAPRCWFLCVCDGRCHPPITWSEPPSQVHAARNGREDVPLDPYSFPLWHGPLRPRGEALLALWQRGTPSKTHHSKRWRAALPVRCQRARHTATRTRRSWLVVVRWESPRRHDPDIPGLEQETATNIVHVLLKDDGAVFPVHDCLHDGALLLDSWPSPAQRTARVL